MSASSARRRARRELFPVNVWPPFVDALTLVLAAFVLLMLIAALAQSGLIARMRAGERELERVREEKARIERRLRALSATGAFEVEEGKVIVQGEVLFASGSDELSPAGVATLGKMGPALAALLAAEPDQMILVGGHTDDVPIANARFASNWELSAARSTAVARALIASGLPPARVLASGFGPYHPRNGNRTPEERSRNRRIEVLVVPIRVVSSR
jgi:flagellar motor protein MotB